MRLENVESFYPLSPLQEGLLFHSLADPTSRMYFNQTAMTLRGQLDVAAFERGLNNRRKTPLLVRFQSLGIQNPRWAPPG